MSDLIDRQAAIDTLDKHLRTTDVPVSYPGIISALTEWLNELPSAQADSKETSSTHKALDTISRKAAIEIASGFCHPANIAKELAKLPSAQPDMSEYSDKLWKRAYERGKAEAQDEIVRCKDCKHSQGCGYPHCNRVTFWNGEDDYCSRAERRTE